MLRIMPRACDQKMTGSRILSNLQVRMLEAKNFKGTSINDVPRFLAIFDLPTFSYPIASDFWGYLGPPYLP